MIPMTSDEQKKKAFGLFKEGRYQESRNLCYHFLEMIKGPTLEGADHISIFDHIFVLLLQES